MSFSKRAEQGLGSRLRSLANHYHSVEEVWDIGCDHGLLGLSFKDIETVKQIYLVDPAIAVINDLKYNLLDSHIPREDFHSKLHIIHKNGQSLTLSSSSKCLFIAGMGGQEILEITQNLIPQMSHADRLVISPHRKILELRNYLNTCELGLVTEEVVEENNQFYQILVLAKREDLPKTSLYGTNLWQGGTGSRYLAKELTNFSVHQDPLSKAYVQHLKAIIA